MILPRASRRGRQGWAAALAIAAAIAGGPLSAAAAEASSATVPAARGAAFLSRHEKFLERARQGNIDLLFLGDSITEFWDREGAPVWKEEFEALKAANFGSRGDRTQNVLWRIRNGELDGVSPKAVVLMIGTNNIPENTPDEVVEGVTAVVNSIRAKLPRTRILLLGIFPRADKPNFKEAVPGINTRLARLGDGKRVIYLDIGSKLADPTGAISKEIMPDSLHLSEKGYRIWAGEIRETVRKLMAKNDARKGG